MQGFQGVDYSTKGDRGNGPVQFEKDPVEADPFGLDQIISEVRPHKPCYVAWHPVDTEHPACVIHR